MTNDELIANYPLDLTRALDLSDVAKAMQRAGKRPHVDEVRRWTRGYRCRGWDGDPIVLASVMDGRRLLVMPEWLAAFLIQRAEMGRRVAAARQPVPSRNPRQASAAHARSMERLKTMGLVGK